MRDAPINLPREGEVVLDHVGHFVPDAAACADALTAAGFTVTPYSAQVVPDPETGEPTPTGTGNVCVMLGSGYLEFLVHTADTPLGQEFQAALARRAGLHLAAFAVPDAEATHAALSADGWPMRPLARFSRTVGTEDGEATARFTVARLEKGTMPEGRIQLLTHHDEAAIWQPRWVTHENSAVGLSGMTIAAPDPAEAAARFSRLFGRPAEATAAGHAVRLDRGVLTFVEEAAGTHLAGRDLEPGQPAIVAYSLKVADLETARDAFARAGIGAAQAQGALVVRFPEALGLGVWIVHTG
ncbi:VOC family protein [Acuticoccus sp. MNP-M23]|uniref:VOC family protein n=1 Tax=Acuticoccus sp. MNP-M23 TaxID=3072793 RepID=UPI0028167A3C|nr:VOC family protein [Acuticoccus sp. MNP-M23]WMS42237.1 VOC family protein [Acuticoccus sp. MNP-M23]